MSQLDDYNASAHLKGKRTTQEIALAYIRARDAIESKED